MRRMTYFVMALALVLGFTQCKKEQTNENNNTDEGEKVTITLNVDNGFSKGHVTPGENTAPVYYDNGDKILVGYNNAYIGELTYDGSVFTGSLSITKSGDQPLHFYYLAGMSQGVTENQCTVDISDQSSRLGIISYGTSDENYSGTGEYNAYLRNQCGLVKFTTQNIPDNVIVLGMNNSVNVNFATQEFTSTSVDGGGITLNKESNTTRWAILPVQAAVSTAKAYAFSSVGVTVSVPEVTQNMYYASGDGVNVPPMSFALFFVAENSAVQFSPGNLQYKAGQGWRFAKHQYDCIGAWNTSNWVDHFGWGTWGEGTVGNVTNPNPLNVSTTNTDYAWSSDFLGTLNGYSTWRTLTKDEWEYLFDHSTQGWSTVAGVEGYVLRPYGNTTAVASSYSAGEWAAEEASGSVFLPAAGTRYGTTVDYFGDYGHYWSSSHSLNIEDVDVPWYLYFYDGEVTMYRYNRYAGHSVRLVR